MAIMRTCLPVLLCAAAYIFYGCPAPQPHQNHAVVNVINNSNNLIRFLISESAELVFYSDFFGGYLITNNIGEISVEIESGNTAVYTVEFGNELSGSRDWVLQYILDGFPGDGRGNTADGIMDGYVFESGKTYLMRVTDIPADENFTITCE